MTPSGTELYNYRVSHLYTVGLNEGWDYLLFRTMVEISGDWQGMIFKDSQNSKILSKLSLKKKKSFPSRLEHGNSRKRIQPMHQEKGLRNHDFQKTEDSAQLKIFHRRSK